MPNLKLDLINEVNIEKYFTEIELSRLSQDPNMNYKIKIDQMLYNLDCIAKCNMKLALIDQYFQDPDQQQAQPVQGNQTQSHKE